MQRKAISDVCDAAILFQRSKTGALIVFERSTKLGDIIDTGTIVDAAPSVSVFGNLFSIKRRCMTRRRNPRRQGICGGLYFAAY